MVVGVRWKMDNPETKPEQKQKTEKKKIRITIAVDPEFYEIFEQLRKNIEIFSYGALENELSDREISKILAKKIKKRGGVV